MNNKDIMILGAGPSGMACAFELFKEGRSIEIIEKNSEIGGLARTLKFGNFRTDIGPHRFFSQNEYLYRLIEDLLAERWIRVNRLTRFYIDGKFLLYPIEIKDALLSVGTYKAFRILLDYFYEKTKEIFSQKEPANFEQFVITEFGRTMAEINMLNYTEKIWGVPCSQISTDWAKQRIKGLSLFSLIKKTLSRSHGGPKSLVDQFYYPDTGSGLVYAKMKERMGGVDVRTECFPCKIVHDTKRIVEVVIQAGDKKISCQPEYLVSSIPITELISLLTPKPPAEVLEAAGRLRFRSHVSLFIILNKSHVFKDQWIYLPDRKIPFGRIMEPRNFSRKMSPENRTSLLVEYFCWEGDTVWNAGKDELMRTTLPWLEELGFIKKDEVVDYYTHREKYAYPVYEIDYRRYLEKVRKYLGFENLLCIGRGGLFKYNNIDHALEMGILAARSLIEGKKYNIEDVGAEQAYFERGYIKLEEDGNGIK